MDKHREQSQFGSIDNSVLSRVTGGETLDDLYDSWSWQFASPSCQDAVQDAARQAWQGSGWPAADQGGLNVWNYGPACSYWGWF